MDFYCRELKLAIEVDGPIHCNKFEEDIFRKGELEGMGIKVIRFTDDEVINNLRNVKSKIKRILTELNTPRSPE